MVGNQDFLPGQGPDTGGIQVENPEGESYLRFFVPSGNEFALPAIGIREVISQPIEAMTAIPNVSPLLLGTLNLRGRVVWVADLGQFLGDSVAVNTEQPEVLIIAIEDQDTILGLAIERNGGMEWLDDKKIKVPSHVTDGMAPFVRGEWFLGENQDQILRLLDHVAILRSARWAT
ncbi:MAG: chemotaxis protein CheW [Microcoleaceae cyanobacterium]|jgi:purine-binding chemotaxis protein CheW